MSLRRFLTRHLTLYVDPLIGLCLPALPATSPPIHKSTQAIHYYRGAGDSQVLAELEGEWVGSTCVAIDTESGIGKCGLTAVQKSEQGKGLAKSLKVIS